VKNVKNIVRVVT